MTRIAIIGGSDGAKPSCIYLVFMLFYNSSLLGLLWVTRLKKVAIVGGSGAGKSTLAIRLSQALGLKTHHIDKFYWQDNWEKRPKPSFLALCQSALEGESWIFDGFPDQHWEPYARELDLLIVLDVPYPVRLLRVMRRGWKFRNQNRVDGPENCGGLLRRDLVFHWIWGWHRTAHSRCLRILKKAPAGVPVVRLTNSKATEKFLAEMNNRPLDRRKSADHYHTTLALTR